MKILAAFLSGAMALAPLAPAFAQGVPQNVADQVVPGANLSNIAEATGIPVQDLVAVAQSKGFATTTVPGAGAAGGTNVAGLGLGAGAVAAGVVGLGLIAVIANDDDDDNNNTTTTTTTN